MNNSWTGERLETFIFGSIAVEHLHRYALAVQLAKNNILLDIACGEGYGANLLSQTAKKVVGVDISDETVQNARKKYSAPNIEFKLGSAVQIPAPDNYFDIVVSFETIEHHDEHEAMMKEIKRVLKPSGLLLISTPDKKNYSDIPNYQNPFHVKELYADEFKNLISKYFKNARYYFQSNGSNSYIIPEKSGIEKLSIYEGSFDSVKKVKPNTLYNIALASDFEIEDLGISIFDNVEVQKILSLQQTETTKKLLDERLSELKNLFTNSRSYKLGRLITAPFRLFRKSRS